jgi:hypothetical protein
MNQKIVDYLQENKEQYSQDVLVEQLNVAGYDTAEINKSVDFVYSLDGTVANRRPWQGTFLIITLLIPLVGLIRSAVFSVAIVVETGMSDIEVNKPFFIMQTIISSVIILIGLGMLYITFSGIIKGKKLALVMYIIISISSLMILVFSLMYVIDLEGGIIVAVPLIALMTYLVRKCWRHPFYN